MYVTPSRCPLAPQEVALRLVNAPGLAWLDGGLSHGREGRFSFVGAAPTETCTLPAGHPQLLARLTELGTPQRHETGSSELAPEDVPRWIGSIGYDALNPRATQQPGICFAQYDALYVFDHQTERAWWVGDDRAACERLLGRMSEPQPPAPREPHAPASSGPHPPAPSSPSREWGRSGDGGGLEFVVGVVEATEATAHCAAIGRALAHIREGDIYQINLARRFEASFTGSALGLFLRMRALSAVPLGLYLEADEQAVLGRSMERFLRYRRSDGSLVTSPIKGTLQRDGDDQAEAKTLRADPKEHAEHAMIVDLMRNDLGRVAHYGSVQIEELMAVLPFAGLSHLVSTVRARTQKNLGLDALLRATFPPGSVTGTPKERAIEIIGELEPFARGVYTGAYGFIDRAGGLSLAVAIRTAVVDGRKRTVTYHAGGGIVEASDPVRETAETVLKAQVFMRALAP